MVNYNFANSRSRPFCTFAVFASANKIYKVVGTFDLVIALVCLRLQRETLEYKVVDQEYVKGLQEKYVDRLSRKCTFLYAPIIMFIYCVKWSTALTCVFASYRVEKMLREKIMSWRPRFVTRWNR